jgi:lipoprotein-anchoring transpeptidase ErfK/SrfK
MVALSRRTFMAGSAAGASCCLAACAGAPVWYAAPDPAFRRTTVRYDTREKPGTIVVDTAKHYLYRVQDGGDAIRYGVGVGGEDSGWSGVATVHGKQEWPDWYPTADYLDRHPRVRPQLRELQGGMGVAGGPQNPLGARALYLWQGNRDTLYRIHGTNEPWTIGQNVSAGCIRLVNDDIIDLYDRTAIGTKVVVLPVGVG